MGDHSERERDQELLDRVSVRFTPGMTLCDIPESIQSDPSLRVWGSTITPVWVRLISTYVLRLGFVSQVNEQFCDQLDPMTGKQAVDFYVRRCPRE